jgi:hypothetical protein
MDRIPYTVTVRDWGGWEIFGFDIPFGAAKWMTFPSSLNMLTSSIAWMGWTLSFFSEVCSFLSSVPDDLWTFLVLRRGVPLPLQCGGVC